MHWVEERARLQHNLLSLQKLLEEREERAAADESAAASLLEKTRNDRDRFKNGTVSLQNAAESLRVELAEALSSLAETHGGVVGMAGEENSHGEIETIATDPPEGGTEEGKARGQEIDPLSRIGSEGSKGNRVVDNGQRVPDHLEDGVFREDAAGVAVGDGVQVEGDKSTIRSGDAARASSRGVREGGETAAGRGGGDVDDRDGGAARGAEMQGSGLWLGGGFEGSVGELGIYK